MDFFGQQEAARRQTSRLVFYFVLAVLCIIAAIHGVVVGITLYYQQEQGLRVDPVAVLTDPGLIGTTTLATLAVIAFGSLFKIAQLRGGGSAVAESLGAVPVNPETRDRDERRLLNVVEEMAIASGTPVPTVYLMPDEPGINAFAAGFNTSDAVVAVTRGTMTRLSRAELQGVVAHEFSHILNGDMRLNIRLMGVLHGILLIALIGQVILRGSGRRRYRSSSRDGKGRALILVIAAALLAIGYLGVFFGRLIKAAVSREREYLADAAAVQFTRNPDGIGGALKKIGGFAGGSELEAPNAESASHLFFGSGLRKFASGAFATHPPLPDRIRRIDPGWDAEYIAESAPPPDRDEPAGVAAFSGVVQPEEKSFALSPQDATARAGAPTAEHVDYAHALLGTLPNALLGAAHSPYGARALAYAMVISRDRSVWQTQLATLQQRADPQVLTEMERVFKLVDALDRPSRLALMTVCVSSLRTLSGAQFRAFQPTLQALIDADDAVSPFEFALLRILRRHLDRHFAGVSRAGSIRRSLSGLADEAGLLLSALAHIGHRDPGAAKLAFEAGLAQLALSTAPALSPEDKTDLTAAGDALDTLEQLRPNDKKRLVAACAATIATDGQVTVEEGEVLRAVCDSLDVPMPPFLADGTPAAAPS